MKKLKTILTAFSLTLFVFTVSSCKKEAKEDDTKEVAKDQNDEKFDDSKKQDDSEILVKAAETNLTEIEIGKLAQTKGITAHTKDFGKMLVADHTKALADLKAFADKKQITIPTAITEDGRKKYDELNEKTGKDFDKKFGDMMVSGHEDAIKMFEDASKNANDPEVRTWAASMLATLQSHLEHAKMVQDENK